VSQARSAATANRSALSTQYNAIMTQITNTITDSKYKGINLLENGSVAVAFNEDNSTSLTVSGFTAAIGGAVVETDSGDLAAFGASTATAASLSSSLDTIETSINDSLDNLRTEAAKLASNLTILQVRNDFLSNTVNNEIEGANKLTLADTNEEGANLLMLQTRQQLGITSLSLASQAAQGVLRLF
jgi:flagellin-like hook-associated protein FlgL